MNKQNKRKLYTFRHMWIRQALKYAYIIAYDCWENGIWWHIAWIIIILDTNLSVPMPYAIYDSYMP